jgi:hypothetical protein
VRFYKTPDSVLQKQLEVYDQVVAKKAAENPLFKEIIDSQRAFAERAVKWDMDNNVNGAWATTGTSARRTVPRGQEGLTPAPQEAPRGHPRGAFF